MALRNAFGEIALDTTVVELKNRIGELEAGYARQMRNQPARSLQYSRDTNDRMRVSVDNSVLAVTSPYWGFLGTYPLWYASGGPASMDAREQQKELSLNTFHAQRRRWTVS